MSLGFPGSPAESGQVDPGPGYQGGQFGDKVHRLEDDVSRAITIAGHLTTYLCLQPQGVDQVRAKIGLIGYDVQSSDQADIDKAVDLFVRTMAEDKIQLEKVSRGLQSRHFQRSALAPIDFEGTTWDFYRYLSENLTNDG